VACLLRPSGHGKAVTNAAHRRGTVGYQLGSLYVPLPCLFSRPEGGWARTSYEGEERSVLRP
jgi:hypothetical protein